MNRVHGGYVIVHGATGERTLALIEVPIEMTRTENTLVKIEMIEKSSIMRPCIR